MAAGFSVGKNAAPPGMSFVNAPLLAMAVEIALKAVVATRSSKVPVSTTESTYCPLGTGRSCR